tara:strand:+ start:1773 stop:2039 length:267 start_codon:yes stop_codon:yes gene_type:complete
MASSNTEKAQSLIFQSFGIDNNQAPLEGISLVGLKDHIQKVTTGDGTVKCRYCGDTGGYADCASGGDWMLYDDETWACFECSDEHDEF